MTKINNYNQFLILEKYDQNIRAKLIELGVTVKTFFALGVITLTI